MQQVINTADGIVSFKLIRKKVRSIRIRVTGDGLVVVSAPTYISNLSIRAFITKNSAIILKRKREIEEKRRQGYPALYKDGDAFLYLGNRMTLKVIESKKADVKMDKGLVILYVPKNMTAREVFIRWASNTALAVFSQRASVFASAFADHDIKISVRNMLTRWGSINTQRQTMSLSVHLLRCETCLIDYVIVHELCHLVYPRHTKAFYGELEKWFPDRKHYDKKLLEYGLVGF